jgi:cellulose synthase/poly-beta-1,6-N-acetylglucosamine synthase-like glycosyltransferase
MAMSTSLILFWSSAAVLFYLYLGYPLLMWIAGKVRPRPVRRREILPVVSVLLVAQNEARVIARRLANLLSLDYPSESLEILVGSDGSTDATAEIARGFSRPSVRIVAYRTRRGKAAVLNDLAKMARGDILVLADARQRFGTGTLKALVAPFEDARVGAVSGEMILTAEPDGSALESGIGVYWRYEKLIRRSESLVDSTVGATGAIYAVRRGLYRPIPGGTILDDVLIPMRIARQGYRVIFEPKARAWDRLPATAREELARKVRTIAGNFQLFARERWLLNPLQNRLWIQTVSHKLLRLASPLLLATLFAATVLLAPESPFFLGTLVAQVLFYMAALRGRAGRGARRRLALCAVAYAVCLLNWATVVGLVRYVGGRQRVTWERVAPAAPVPTGPPPPARRHIA